MCAYGLKYIMMASVWLRQLNVGDCRFKSAEVPALALMTNDGVANTHQRSAGSITVHLLHLILIYFSRKS